MTRDGASPHDDIEMFDLTDRVALVTGGSRGIGRAVAIALASRGARVAVNYVTNAEAADEVVQCISGAGGQAVAVQGDVARADDAVGFRFRVARQFGYGAAPEMTRRCLERLDEEGISGGLTVLRVLSSTRPVATQGPVWRIGGRAV